MQNLLQHARVSCEVCDNISLNSQHGKGYGLNFRKRYAGSGQLALGHDQNSLWWFSSVIKKRAYLPKAYPETQPLRREELQQKQIVLAIVLFYKHISHIYYVLSVHEVGRPADATS